MLQTIIAAIIVLAAVVYLLKRFLSRPDEPQGCPGCKGCKRPSDCGHS